MSRQTHLSLEQAESFSRAMDAYESVKGTDAAKDFFVSIDQQLKGKEILVAIHKTASRFLDQYIAECPVESLHHLFMVFVSKLDEIIFDPSGSHCVEGVINQAFPYIDNKDFKPPFIDLYKSMISNIRDENTIGAAVLSEDKYGSHVMRCIITTLSQCKALNQHIDKLCRSIIQALIKNPEKTRIPQFSAVLQTIAKLDKESNPKLVQYLAQNVPTTFNDISDRSTSRLVEEVIRAGFDKPIHDVYENVFKTSAARAADHVVANFVLQRWLEHCNKEMFTTVSAQLLEDLENLLYRNPEVIVAYCNASARLVVDQDKIIKAFNDYRDGKNLIDTMLSLRKEKAGAQILQAICRFQQKQAEAIVGAFLELPPERLIEVCVSRTGTYVVTEYLRSNLKKNSKRKLVDHLIPIIMEIAPDRAGSYIVEDAFNASDLEKKVEICEEILKHKDAKTEAPNIWRSLKLDSFVSRRGQWEHEMITKAKVEAAMKDIIEDEPAKSFHEH